MGSDTSDRSSVHGRNLIKVLRAVDLLSRPCGATIKELQEGLGISRRSVYRTFEILESLSFPLYDMDLDGQKEKRWKLQDDFLHHLPNLRVPDMRLTPRELLVLYFLLSQDRVLSNTTVSSYLTSIRQKLAAIMPSEYLSAAQSDKIESFFAAGSLHPKNYAGTESTIDALLDAIVERKECTITYHSLSHAQSKSYSVHPLRLFEHHGGLYTFVRIPKHDAIRILAVDRITAIELTDSSFEEPEDFNPEAILGNTFDLTLDDPVTLRIHFSPGVARLIRDRRWSSKQNIYEHEDGSVTLDFETSGREDVVRWVLSFGPDARVIEPTDIKQTVTERLMQTLHRYHASD